ncbi:Cof-type HAD-IIB family hydrolase [Mycoplasmopsis pulmonis]|uniref:Cof-type HAD-IIB family hydrolase n=1 Tax=Mycoplasmopsis pulmonis TaxID=2107 RepID=UPI002ACE15D0|nr:Cof-type HAD-IIB family hydrolase [Mycoplasmopsis pulmonis]MDZ7293261.1 Cof-type HAD-IIB family hydrolase [Mycoplasmopsis pulmonis]
MKKNNQKDKLLICVDLDGTLLSKSSTNEIHEETIKWVKEASNQGHHVCILTGRPWRSTKTIYQRLGLNTIVGNQNGAQIHNPSDQNFVPTIHYLNLNEMLYIIGDEKIQKEMTNLAIEGLGWVQIQKRDPVLESIFGFKDAEKFVVGIDLNKIPLKPTGIVFDVKETTDPVELQSFMTKKYGDLGEFSYWSKGKESTSVFDITSLGVNKGKVVPLLRRYYDIPWENTVSIGDSFNDVPMFKKTNISVTVKNADPEIKSWSTVRWNKTNEEGGVGLYLKKLLENPELEIEKSLEVHRKNRIKRKENGN